MTEQALADLKVLDLTHFIAGPYCTKLLADYGADVIKVEKPKEGDGARHLGPFKDNDPHPEKSGLFLHLNTNKRSITLNLKTDTGKKIFKEMLSWADLVVENFEPRVMPSLGLDYATLSKINPRLVMTSISNYGQWGPYRDYKASELTFNGTAGDMYTCGLEDREPSKLADNCLQFQAGAISAVATMGAILWQRATGEGQQVDVSIFETMCGDTPRRVTHLVTYAHTGEVATRLPMGSIGYPAGVYPCADGYVDITGGVTRWDGILEMMGEDAEPLRDPRWRDPMSQVNVEMKQEFEAIFLGWTLQHSKYEIWRRGQAAKVLCAPLNAMSDLTKDPQFQQRGVFIEVEHPVVGKVTQIGRPFIMQETPWQLRRPAPLLGQHNQEVYSQLGYSKDDLVRLRQAGVI